MLLLIEMATACKESNAWFSGSSHIHWSLNNVKNVCYPTQKTLFPLVWKGFWSDMKHVAWCPNQTQSEKHTHKLIL